MNDLSLIKFFPVLVFIAVGVAVAILYKKRLAKVLPDDGSFQLTRWSLERELADQLPPRAVRPKNVDREKRKFYLMTCVPILFILFAFLLGGFKDSGRTRPFLPFIQSPMIGIVLIWGIILVSLLWKMRKRLEVDLELLAHGEALGAKVLSIHQHKNQITVRLRFVFDGKIHERGYVDSFAFFLKKIRSLAPGDEVTILVNPKNPKQIALYMDMHAVIQGAEAYALSGSDSILDK